MALREGGLFLSGREGRGECLSAVSLRMNARVLSVLFQSVSTVEGEFVCERAPPLRPEVELQLPIQEVVFVLVQLLNVQCIM